MMARSKMATCIAHNERRYRVVGIETCQGGRHPLVEAKGAVDYGGRDSERPRATQRADDSCHDGGRSCEREPQQGSTGSRHADQHRVKGDPASR